jgi:hypothetical protein
MPSAVCQTMEALCAVTQGLPVGTNLALLHFLWMQLSGALLPSRGALFPALQAIGLLPSAVRRAWAAFHSGAGGHATRCADWLLGPLSETHTWTIAARASPDPFSRNRRAAGAISEKELRLRSLAQGYSSTSAY